jgi:hypothetical protein
MPCACRRLRSFLLIFLSTVAVLATCPARSQATDLQPETVQAYERYVRSAEARMAREVKLPERFLHIESMAPAAQRSIWAMLKRGDVWLAPLDATDEAGHEITAPHSTITHWVGGAFIPGATIGEVLGVIRDFDHFQDIYKPEIVRSRVLVRNDETYQVFLRVHKETPWVNPTLNINATVTLTLLDSGHAQTHTASTSVAQVENAGKPGEHEDSVGQDSGYLWRLDTFWRLESRDGGVVAEWEAITLSRDIPFLLRWFVRPFVERLARQTLRAELVATRNEVEKRRRAANPKP